MFKTVLEIDTARTAESVSFERSEPIDDQTLLTLHEAVNSVMQQRGLIAAPAAAATPQPVDKDVLLEQLRRMETLDVADMHVRASTAFDEAKTKFDRATAAVSTVIDATSEVCLERMRVEGAPETLSSATVSVALKSSPKYTVDTEHGGWDAFYHWWYTAVLVPRLTKGEPLASAMGLFKKEVIKTTLDDIRKSNGTVNPDGTVTYAAVPPGMKEFTVQSVTIKAIKPKTGSRSK